MVKASTHPHVPLCVAGLQTIPNTPGERVRTRVGMAKDKDNTNKQCFQYKLVAGQWKARSRLCMELLTHFSPRMRKSYLKISGVPRSIRSANRVPVMVYSIEEVGIRLTISSSHTPWNTSQAMCSSQSAAMARQPPSRLLVAAGLATHRMRLR